MSTLELENLIYRCIDNWAAGRRHERYGLCSSYDDKNHLAKAIIQPDGVETSWIPIEVQHAGNGFGALIGLTPGDNQKPGDQVIVQFQEGEFEAGRVVGRVHSEVDQAPQVKSGEMLHMDSKGHNLFFDKDGNQTLWHNMGDPPKGQKPPPSPATQDGDKIKGSYRTFDKDGNQTAFSNKKKITHDDGNGATHVHDGNGNIAATAKTIKHTATNGDMTHSVQNGNYARSASQNITDAAQAITHNGKTTLNGDTNVIGNHSVTNLLSAGLMSVTGGFSGGGGMNMSGLSKLLGGAQIFGGGSATGGFTVDKLINGGSASGPTVTAGTGAPASVQPASSVYQRTDGSVGSLVYVSNGTTWTAIA